MADQDTTLGALLFEQSPSRDAIHVAVLMVIASEPLAPGEHIGFLGDPALGRVSGRAEKPLGIVDPFLTTWVQPNERFYMVLYPRTITSLQHIWTHPAVPSPTAPAAVATIRDRAKAIEWLQAFENEHDGLYDIVAQIERADFGFHSGDNQMDWGDISDEDTELFWEHAETVLGRRITRTERDNSYFSCAC